MRYTDKADYYLANISLSHTPGFDFGSAAVIISADSDVRYIPSIIDDNVNEDEQSFAVVAEILNVPESISCFQIQAGMTECYGNRGATEIRIVDNDGKNNTNNAVFS